MSKIPQGDWSAIAARYQSGESISKIARSYDCTPPAIHYILKRHGQPRLKSDGAPGEGRPAMASAEVVAPVPQPAATSNGAAAPPTLVRMRPPAPVPAQAPRLEPVAAEPAEPPRVPPTPGLDSDLHRRAETAIEVFRTSFDAALSEGSPGVRAQLRQAASDLMRIAARTTIVLDRLSASAERAARSPDYPRSARAR